MIPDLLVVLAMGWLGFHGTTGLCVLAAQVATARRRQVRRKR